MDDNLQEVITASLLSLYYYAGLLSITHDSYLQAGLLSLSCQTSSNNGLSKQKSPPCIWKKRTRAFPVTVENPHTNRSHINRKKQDRGGQARCRKKSPYFWHSNCNSGRCAPLVVSRVPLQPTANGPQELHVPTGSHRRWTAKKKRKKKRTNSQNQSCQIWQERHAYERRTEHSPTKTRICDCCEISRWNLVYKYTTTDNKIDGDTLLCACSLASGVESVVPAVLGVAVLLLVLRSCS